MLHYKNVDKLLFTINLNSYASDFFLMVVIELKVYNIIFIHNLILYSFSNYFNMYAKKNFFIDI